MQNKEKNESNENFTSLIVGGHSGIGLSIKKALATRGDYIYTASRRKVKDIKHFQINNNTLTSIPTNIKINYLIFSHRYRGKDWDDALNIGVKMIVEIIERLKNSFSEESSILIIGSNSGIFCTPEQDAAYHASRSALTGLSKYYAQTLGHLGIRCNILMPNTIIKPENSIFFDTNNSIPELIKLITPLKRMGTSEDIARVVEFFCSPKSNFITGQSLHVDGGLSIVSQEYISKLCMGIN